MCNAPESGGDFRAGEVFGCEMIEGRDMHRLIFFEPHFGQWLKGESEIRWTTSNALRHLEQSYSYVGISVLGFHTSSPHA